jgi:hypothetical protein
VAAATSAIKLGCVNFIKNGDESGKGRRGVLLAKLDAGTKKDEDDVAGKSVALDGETGTTTGPDIAVMEIENCCTEWRAGDVSPQWVYFFEPKVTNGTDSPHRQSAASDFSSQRTDVQLRYPCPLISNERILCLVPMNIIRSRLRRRRARSLLLNKEFWTLSNMAMDLNGLFLRLWVLP